AGERTECTSRAPPGHDRGRAPVVGVGEDGRGLAGLPASRRLVALAVRPGVIASLGDDVQLFEVLLADVPQPELACRVVEAEAPRIAEARGPDLATLPRLARVRVVGGDGSAGNVEPKDLAFERAQVLRIGVRARARILPREVTDSVFPDADVELAVRPDPQTPSVVIARCAADSGKDDHQRAEVDGVVHAHGHAHDLVRPSD